MTNAVSGNFEHLEKSKKNTADQGGGRVPFLQRTDCTRASALPGDALLPELTHPHRAELGKASAVSGGSQATFLEFL